jgi:hypothetical protein
MYIADLYWLYRNSTYTIIYLAKVLLKLKKELLDIIKLKQS